MTLWRPEKCCKGILVAKHSGLAQCPGHVSHSFLDIPISVLPVAIPTCFVLPGSALGFQEVLQTPADSQSSAIFPRFCSHPANTGQKLRVTEVFGLLPSPSHQSYVTLAFVPSQQDKYEPSLLQPYVPGTRDIYCSFLSQGCKLLPINRAKRMASACLLLAKWLCCGNSVP